YQAAAAATATAPAVVGVEANGEQTRYAPQAWFYRGNFGALAEYVSSEQAVQRGTNEADLRNDAWQLQLNYVLTAEDAGYKGVKPRIAFKPGAEGWGAFEVALRYGELDIDDEAYTGSSMARFANPTTQASKVAAAGLALNWYLTNNAKLALDYEHTRFDGGGGGSTAAPEDRKDEDVILARVQLAY
ncbi:MAG: porin, partial [Solimonas sp.]